MALKRRYAKEEDIPKDSKALYVKQGDEWVLDADDTEELRELRKKVSEFRETNLELKRTTESQAEQLAAIQARFKDFDPERLEAGLKALQQIEDEDERKLIQNGKIDTVLERRTAKMREGYERELAALKKANASALEELTGLRTTVNEGRLDEALTGAIGSRKLKPLGTALPDIRARARGTFRFDEKGNIVARTGKGEAVFNKKGEALTLEDFVTELVDEAPHLFEAAGGGGGGGNRDAGNPPAGVMRIKRGDHGAMSKHAKELASGKAVLVDE